MRVQTGTFDVWTIGFHAYVGATVVAMRTEARCSGRGNERQCLGAEGGGRPPKASSKVSVGEGNERAQCAS